MGQVLNISAAPSGLAIARVMAASCFAGVVLFTGNPSALGDTSRHPVVPLHVADRLEPARLAPVALPVLLSPERPAITVSITTLDPNRLGPDAFADWIPAER